MDSLPGVRCALLIAKQGAKGQAVKADRFHSLHILSSLLETCVAGRGAT